jgi:putative glycerol-1-phosphate prenyltransferase
MVLERLNILKQQGKKAFAVLIDPDKITEPNQLNQLIMLSQKHRVDFFLVGGSLLTEDCLNEVVVEIKQKCSTPVVLFPGSNMHINASADALLFLSLISGRNPELLIGQHVVAAPILRKTQLEILPTGYMLVGGGLQTTVAYMSNTAPIPNNKPAIAACTAMAGEMLGLKLMYLDAGSGAPEPINPAVIKMVSRSVSCPIVVGGGIRSVESAARALEAGADMLVVGNGIEKNLDLLAEVSTVVQEYNATLNVH